MSWRYEQSTGNLSRSHRLVARGYAGKGSGKNNPEMEGQQNVGPLPKGKYTITGQPFTHPHTGKYSIRLQPSPDNKMFGRAGFLIHGDSANHPGSASNGCIILPLPAREEIWKSGDRQLEVVK